MIIVTFSALLAVTVHKFHIQKMFCVYTERNMEEKEQQYSMGSLKFNYFYILTNLYMIWDACIRNEELLTQISQSTTEMIKEAKCRRNSVLMPG